MNLIDPIIAFHSEIQSIRRDLHAHPELRYEENRTADIVAAKLGEWGIPVIRGLGKTGVVGIIRNGQSSRAIGLRADMDALPVQEMNTFAHASRHEGKMHACGHDGHTAMLLGAAHYLATQRDFDGTVYVIFQPAEEGGRGADAMIKDGLLEQCPMDTIFGMHNWPGIPVGSFGVKPGPIMASSNYFDLKIKGKGSHAAQPHMSIDPLVIGAQVVLAWQTIISRNANPHESAVLSIAQFHAGSANNIIADAALISGTVRTFSTAMLDLVEGRMREIAVHTAAAHGAEVEFNFNRLYPPLVNHARETAFAVRVMQSVVGAENVNANVEPSMTGEDFSFMMMAKPGCYVWIGNGEGAHRESGHAEGPCNLHNPSYDFNDELLPIGATYWVRLAQEFLKHD
ncbi:MAG: M20 aminoacylase family protein [Janthinobacterium lividum]